MEMMITVADKKQLELAKHLRDYLKYELEKVEFQILVQEDLLKPTRRKK